MKSSKKSKVSKNERRSKQTGELAHHVGKRMTQKTHQMKSKKLWRKRKHKNLDS